jgi:hypothetical protein
MRGQQLAGIHQPVGIEDGTETKHEVQVGVSVLHREVLGLVHAHAVLARHAAAQRDARAQQLLVGLLGLRELLGRVSS